MSNDNNQDCESPETIQFGNMLKMECCGAALSCGNFSATTLGSVEETIVPANECKLSDRRIINGPKKNSSSARGTVTMKAEKVRG